MAVAKGPGGWRAGLLGKESVELVATIVLSFAVVLTAWSAFEAGKWSGVQAVNFSEAGAARTESVRLDTLAGQSSQLDIAAFNEWSAALGEDVISGRIEAPRGGYTPDTGTRSGFLFARIRPEFRDTVEDWLATGPITNPDAPATPFEMEDYVNQGALDAEELRFQADELAADARAANQNGDNYVLATVLFAAVLFFAGVSSKLSSERNRGILLAVSVAILLAGTATVLSFPIEF